MSSSATKRYLKLEAQYVKFVLTGWRRGASDRSPQRGRLHTPAAAPGRWPGPPSVGDPSHRTCGAGLAPVGVIAWSPRWFCCSVIQSICISCFYYYRYIGLKDYSKVYYKFINKKISLVFKWILSIVWWFNFDFFPKVINSTQKKNLVFRHSFKNSIDKACATTIL